MYRPAVASVELVEVGIIVAPGVGTALPLINWRMEPTTKWELTIDNGTAWLPAFSNATIASTSSPVRYVREGSQSVRFTMPMLEVGDALILR